MIQNPQIFIIYLPGMFGSCIANVLMHHPLLINDQIKKTALQSDNGLEYNSHQGPYKDLLPNFHRAEDIDIHTKSNQELEDFFYPIRNIPLGIHRISDYRVAKFNFEKNFTNPLRLILLPENIEDINIWGERMFYAAEGGDVSRDYFYPKFKKGVENVKKELIEGLGIKEKTKYAMSQYKDMVQNDIKNINLKNSLIYDPKKMSSVLQIQSLMDQVCNILKITKFVVPEEKLESFLEKNKIWFEKFD